MTITSRFYTGFVDNEDWAAHTQRLGARYAVAGYNDFRVETDNTGVRQVKIAAAGVAFGGGIEDTYDATPVITVTLPNPASGSAWHLVGIDRVWGGTNASTVTSIAGTSTKQIPTRPTTPGVEDFQPLALVRVTKDVVLPAEIVDLRVVLNNAGLLVAFDDLTREYMNQPGTVLQIGESVQWFRTITAAGTSTWVQQWLAPNKVGETIFDTGWVNLEFNAGWEAVPGRQPQVRRVGTDVQYQGAARTISGSQPGGTHNPCVNPTGLGVRPSVRKYGSMTLGSGTSIQIRIEPTGEIDFANLPTNYGELRFDECAFRTT